MTISQLIQTISLGNFTYFMRFHGHFPHFLHKPWRIITGTAWQTADNRHWEGAHWARGVDLEHIGRGTLFECSLFGRSLAGGTLPRVILFRENVLEPNHESPPEYNDSPPENLDEHHFFDVNGNIAFTSAEVRFSTRLICSFDERNSKRSRLAKSYFCVLLKSRNEFTS